MDCKRRKSDVPFFDDQNGPAENDYFNESTHVLNSSSSGESTTQCIRSSWMCDVKWISRNNDLMCPQLEVSSLATLESHLIEVKEQIHHICKKLILIKRRFAPQADELAILCNHIGHRTTGRHEFEDAREACNIYESLGEGKCRGLNTLFMNRAAIKLANIDALIGFCLTVPQNCIELKFVDLCGAPGGFSEYIQWRCQCNGISSKGFGMSLIGNNEHGGGAKWKLKDNQFRRNGQQSTFLLCYGKDNTGDIYRWENLEYLRDLIQYNSTQQSTDDDWKVQLVLADGGFDAQRDSENQEEISQKLIVCEVAGALLLLKLGGMLIIKMFGFQTPVISAVMNYLFSTFQSVIVIKPINSRPASAERYVCCSGFYGNPENWDGQKWCNTMLLGYNYEVPSITDAMDNEILLRKFQNYLCEWDRDLFNLNLKACFSILSHMENKCRRIKNEGTDLIETSEIQKINTTSYKYAWRLV